MLKSPLQSFLFYRMPKKLQIEKRQQKGTDRFETKIVIVVATILDDSKIIMLL